MPTPTIFLLSPATAHGARASTLLAPGPRTPAAQRLHSAEGMPLGEVFRYLSGLYFNGKLAYARAFARPPASLHDEGGGGVLVITMTDGLLAPETPIGADDLRRYAAAEQGSEAGRAAVERDARALAERAGPRCGVVLLGSLATGKYTEVLLPAFGERLLYPRALLGLGQLDRGALLFRCVREGRELDYAPVAAIERQPAKRSTSGTSRTPRASRTSGREHGHAEGAARRPAVPRESGRDRRDDGATRAARPAARSAGSGRAGRPARGGRGGRA